MLTKTQKIEIVKGATDWAFSNGFTHAQAIEYANEVLKKEIESPQFNDGVTTPFTREGN